MQWLIGYDIHQHRQRRKACKILRSHSTGYQDSAFECSTIHTPQYLLWQLQGQFDSDDYLYTIRHPGRGPDWQLGCNNTATSQNELLLFV